MKPPAAESMPSRPSPGADTRPPTNILKHLRKAAGSKDPTALPAFLQDNPSLALSDIDSRDYDGRTALHMASWRGAISNVSLLLDMGCNINTIATKPHNYRKSPIFFAATRSRLEVMNLLLDRGANVLIVNNKGQSVYSIACSHFDSELVQRIQQIEKQQEQQYDQTGQEGNDNLKGWVDYRKTHSDGNIYGDLDLRFLGRPLTETDVVKDGVVNPTTKESRKGNFARNNPSKVWKRKDETKKKKKQPPARTKISDEERMQLEKSWDQAHVALRTNDSWGLFSSLLSIVQFMEEKKIQSSWVVESASRLDFLLRLEQALWEVAQLDSDTKLVGETSFNNLKSVLSEAIVFCGAGDRHATLVKRILSKAGEESNQIDGMQNRNNYGEMSLTENEKAQLDLFWNDTYIALNNNDANEACVSMVKVIVLWDGKNCPWLNEATAKLHSMLKEDSVLKDSIMKEMLDFCDGNGNRYASLLKKMLTKTISTESRSVNGAKKSSNDDRQLATHRKAKKKEHPIPTSYELVIKSLQASFIDGSPVPSWAVLMNHDTTTDKEAEKYLSLPSPPKWVDSPHDLKCLRSKLHEVIDNSNSDTLNNKMKFEHFVAFDSEFRSEYGSTELATIQFSIIEDGLPLAWVVDLNPNPADAIYSTMTCDILRWIFIESDARIVGFAHRHDLHMISSYIGEDIPFAANFVDIQLLALHKMTDDTGCASDTSSLPGLKSCCSYFLEASGKMVGQKDMKSWSLSKNEQCSNWAQRPLTASQLQYAGLDAAVLLVLLAEIVRS